MEDAVTIDVESEIDMRHNRLFNSLLYQAALRGEWNKAEPIFRCIDGTICARITQGNDTPLHIAAAAEQTEFVKEMVSGEKWMKKEDLVLVNEMGDTAFCNAAASGNVELARVMVARDRNLPMIRGRGGKFPIHIAALSGHKEMVRYLYKITDDEQLDDSDRIGVVIAVIKNTDLYDLAFEMVRNHPALALARDPSNHQTVLHALSRKRITSQQGIWGKIFNKMLSAATKILLRDEDLTGDQSKNAVQLTGYLWEEVASKLNDRHILELISKPWPLVIVAAEQGNIEFLTALIRLHPSLIMRSVDDEQRSIFHIAVLHRHDDIFKVIYELDSVTKHSITTSKDKDQNNMLHYAGKKPPPSRLNIVSGAALQMQQELLWFKAVKNLMPLFAEEANLKGVTPAELFRQEHEGLMKEGEKWMKDTANSCMLVATLITTVAFAAAFTIPGGTRENTGTPIFLGQIPFKIFAIADGASLICSSTSILTFLSILTARYTEQDFDRSLPSKLTVGIATLFVSIVTMMVAFSATFFITFHEGIKEVAIVIAATSSIPLVWFVVLLRQLFLDIVQYTCLKSKYLFQRSKSTIF